MFFVETGQCLVSNFIYGLADGKDKAVPCLYGLADEKDKAVPRSLRFGG